MCVSGSCGIPNRNGTKIDFAGHPNGISLKCHEMYKLSTRELICGCLETGELL